MRQLIWESEEIVITGGRKIVRGNTTASTTTTHQHPALRSKSIILALGYNEHLMSQAGTPHSMMRHSNKKHNYFYLSFIWCASSITAQPMVRVSNKNRMSAPCSSPAPAPPTPSCILVLKNKLFTQQNCCFLSKIIYWYIMDVWRVGGGKNVDLKRRGRNQISFLKEEISIQSANIESKLG